MLKKICFILLFCIGFIANAQIVTKDFKKKTFFVKKDTLQLDSVPINSQLFKVFNANNKLISKEKYKVDFYKALLIIDSKKFKTITVEYFRLPEFLTKIYTPLDSKLIINQPNTNKLYSLTTNKKPSDIKLFSGLQTRGFITRGVTSGNNQNLVTNSSLDLEISGKLSKNVTLKANIFDTNIPIQQNGYSQNFTDFDRIFVEIYAKNWKVRAGDISLENKNSFFVPFTKQVAGLKVDATINDNLKIGASGAVVRGKFNNFRFTATEGNQGPYKLFGANNEPAILIIENSDRVFVNGIQVERGANKDYIINYNLGEIIFNTTYPITNDMRITVEFQYSERNYTRFITYNKSEYQGEKFGISGYFYSENDAKNQPLQQSLTVAQKQILANAGNDTDAMVAESAFIDEFDENKILYRKVTNTTGEFFEYSTDKNETLYKVTYTNVGQSQGSYVLDRTTAIGNIFVFVGQNQGNYLPIIRLAAPTKSQFFVVQSNYNPSKKTKIDTEIALSNNDVNLFSDIDNNQNKGLAAKINWQQILLDKKWKLISTISHEFAHKNFRTLQRWESIEFNRDWNILTNVGTKNYFQSEINFSNTKENFVLYRFNLLNYTDIFNGTKHQFLSKLNFNKTTLSINSSFLQNTSTLEDNSFLVARARVEHSFKKSWLGAFINLETNSRQNINTKDFINTSHRFKEYESYFGIGDSTKVFAKIGINYRDNDSIKSNRFTQINNRKTFYINSRIIQNKKTKLSVFANYRLTNNSFTTDEKTLNSQVRFSQKLFNNFVNISTLYETASGNVARQEFIYVKTEPGLGYYTWIDYNNDGVQDFDEFEVAEFQDQANYLRLPKPNLRFLPTQRAKIQQTLNLNFSNWSKKKGLRNIISHFINQSSLTVNNEQERIGNTFNFNPFNIDDSKLIALNLNFRNTLFYNKNLQKYSTSYTYSDSQIKQQFLIGVQENNLTLHQIDFAHKFSKFWLIELLAQKATNKLATENFNNRNFRIISEELQPKISFLYNQNNRFSGFYQYKNKRNRLQNLETLLQHKFGVEYYYISKKQNQISANVNVFLNDFVGNTNSPVAYQMLEGLQAGRNYTWNLIFNQKLNSFLNLNLSYLGRKSENSKAIHTGSIQLRADF